MAKGTIHTFPILFFSAGTPLAGVLHRNVDELATPQPAILVTGSWLTVKEQMPSTYANALAARGFTTFTFDFAGFGESGGEPRQAELPHRKIGDIMAAAEFLRSLSSVREGSVGHLAVCASAQYGLAALARGAAIDSFVSVAGWYHDTESVSPFYGGATGVARRIEVARKATSRFLRTREVETAPAYDPGNELAGMFFELPYYALTTRGAVPSWKNEMATMSWLHWLSFDGLSAASRVSQPAFFVHGDGCVLPDNAKRVYEALTGRKDMLWTEGSQIDFYDQPALVEKSVDAADRHFRQSLR